MVLEGRGIARRLPALEQPLLDVGIAGGRKQRRKPVEPGDYLVGDLARP